MAVAPCATSSVHLIEKVLEFCPDMLGDPYTRKALRRCCRRLREAVDAAKPFTAVRFLGTEVSEAFWTSRIVPSCKILELISDVDTVDDANALIASLGAAPLPVMHLLLMMGVRQEPVEVMATLSPLGAATWPAHLASLSLSLSFRTDFSVFDLLSFPDLEEVRFARCQGDNMAALWRCLTERSGNVRFIGLRDIETPEDLLSSFLAAKSAHLEEISVICEEMEIDLMGLGALATATLPKLEKLHMTPLLGPEELNLSHAPWVKSIKELHSRAATSEGLTSVLLGARGGQLRKLHLDMETFDDPFNAVELPALVEVNISPSVLTDDPWLGHGLFGSKTLPALETVSLDGYHHLELDDTYPDDDVLPALKHLRLEGFHLLPASAAAIGKRLPLLTSFWLETEDDFNEVNVRTMLNEASTYRAEWATERLTLRSHMEDALRVAKDLSVLVCLMEAAPRMTKIKALDFHGGVGEMGAQQWVEAAQKGLWPQLEELYVGMVGDKGLEVLSGNLGGWKQLRKLRIFVGSAVTGFDAAAAFPGVADVKIRQN